MRLRKRAGGMILGAGVLFLLGTNVQAGWLFVLSALLLGTAVAGTALPRRMVGGLDVERRAPDEVVAGDEVGVELVLTNRARAVRLGVSVDDPFLAPTSVHVTQILPGERVELTTARVAARRGVHDAVGVVLRSAAPFGVAERRRHVAVSGSTIVLPSLVPLGPLPFLDRGSDAERSSRSSDRRGAGPEYLGVRDYRAGDSPRHVHWPSTARTGTVMVRELEEERSRRLVLVVDTLTDVGDERTPLDACCTAAASIADRAIADGARVGLAPAGPTAEAGRGDDLDLHSLRRLLAAVTASGVPFAETIATGAEVLAGADVVVLVFPTWRTNADPALGAAVAGLAARGRVAAIPVEVGLADARRVAALRPDEVDGLARTLAEAGAHVFPWRHGQDLASALAVEPAAIP